MSSRPKLLDLFCGAGGCAVGYHRAGFDVVGVDIEPQPRYPFEFDQSCAIETLEVLLGGGIIWSHPEADQYILEDFAAIHASPPCQAYSENMRHLSSPAQMLIEPIRAMLAITGKPWIIENVEGAPLATETDLFGFHGVQLCGTQFGLRIWRHRLFETSFQVPTINRCRHRVHPLNPHREESRARMRAEFGQVDLEKIWREEAGVGWMDKESGRQAIPPAYTEFIGKQLIRQITDAQPRGAAKEA